MTSRFRRLIPIIHNIIGKGVFKCLIRFPSWPLFQKSTSRYEDELAWAAVWLYRATKDTYYLGQAEGIYREANFYSPKYFAWDDKRAGVMVSGLI